MSIHRSPLVIFVLLAAGAAAFAEDARPNVIVVLTDDQGYGDLGLHGNSRIRTPNLDQFARNGIELTRFYVEPVCAPTRASLLTGRSYYRTGVIHTSRGGAKMHGDEVTLAERFRAAGYRTGVFGKWHLGDNVPMRPGDQGFEESLVHASGGIDQTPDKPNSYFDPKLRHNGEPVGSKGYCTDVFFDAALAFIEKHRSEPFLVYLPTNAPHTPLQVPEEYLRPYREAGLDDTTARVYGMVTNIDDNFGRLLKTLGDLGLRENTILVFLTDNGPQQSRYNAGLRGRKSWTYEGGVRVPFFVQWPAKWKGNRRLDTIAAHVDLLPTLLEACGIDRSDTKLDGRSLLPLLAADNPADVDWPDRALFLQCHRGLTPTKYRNAAVVTQRWKLVLGPGTFAKPTDDPEPRFELYDIPADPGEGNDLAAEHPDVVARVRKQYDAWFDDVEKTRSFEPGRIVVGSEAENPIRLCRYQDGRYVDGVSTGWPVRIAKTGRYEVAVRREQPERPGTIHVQWQGRETTHPVTTAKPKATFDLEAGTGLLNVWFQPKGRDRKPITDNGTLGDAVLRMVE